jgi:multidrug efflux pump subunit AcrB
MSSADIADLTDTVNGYLNGNAAGTLKRGGSELDIKVRIDPDKAGDIYAIGQLPVPAADSLDLQAVLVCAGAEEKQ